jgi:hypothetical protein
MNRRLTEEDGRRALRDHIIEKGLRARGKYGPSIDEQGLQRLLADPDVVRSPTSVRFDAGPLEAGEPAWVEPLGSRPADGFCVVVHPRYRGREGVLPLLVLYQLVRVNYGEIATHGEAELFGATVLGKDVDDYYETLCGLADELSSSGPR